MTRLWPSTYSSRHTTHSTCLALYVLRFLGASGTSLRGAEALALAFSKDAETASETPDVVADRCLVRPETERGLCCSRGVVGDEEWGEVKRVEDAVDDAERAW